ncbi:hypothetical protein ABIA38_001291 [Embleya sp. AB8]
MHTSSTAAGMLAHRRPATPENPIDRPRLGHYRRIPDPPRRRVLDARLGPTPRTKPAPRACTAADPGRPYTRDPKRTSC